MEDFSEENLKANCLHCDPNCWVFDYLLSESKFFYVLCDPNPIIEGHLLIIPKRHVSCVGAYTQEEYEECKQLYDKVSGWILEEYGSIATFEHGKIGQTVFHSHIHLMPFTGAVEQIIPEGNQKLQTLESISTLSDIYQAEGQYLFVSIGEKMWVVDSSLGVPRFFRDRFARVLNKLERGNWKELRKNSILLQECHEDNVRCQAKITKRINPIRILI